LVEEALDHQSVVALLIFGGLQQGDGVQIRSSGVSCDSAV